MIEKTLQSACCEAELGSPSVVLICGTGYIMADALQVLGIVRPRDDN